MKQTLIALSSLLLALTLSACGSSAQPGTERAAGDAPPQETAAQKSPAQETAAQEPAPTEPAAPAEPDDHDAYETYYGILTGKREGILAYDWQKGTKFDEDAWRTVSLGETRNVALTDVWGDDTPELLFIAAEPSNFAEQPIYPTLYVYGADGALLLTEPALDFQVGGGMTYRLFQADGEKNLWIFCEYYSEGTETSFRKYAASGEMTVIASCSHLVGPNADYTEMIDGYRANDQEATREAYEAIAPGEDQQARGLIMRGLHPYEYIKEITPPENPTTLPQDGSAVSYDAAIALLREKLDIQPEPLNETAFYSSLPDFWFASGVGGWSTELKIAPDGSFSGSFHDSDMGTTGPGYPNGTVYVCAFSGKFTDLKRVDDYTRSMRVAELNTEMEPEQEWIEDNVRYVSSTPYGLDGADEILVYLPGAQVSKLPDAFVQWVAMPRAWGSERPVLLPCYGLYNVAGEEGFSGEN